MKTYKIAANVMLMIEANSEQEAWKIAADDLRGMSNVKRVRKTIVKEANEVELVKYRGDE